METVYRVLHGSECFGLKALGLGVFWGLRGLRVEVLGLCGLGLFWVRGSEFWGVQGGSLLGRTF